MNFFQEVQAYRQYLRDSRKDLTPLMVFSLIWLFAGSGWIIGALKRIAPAAAAAVAEWPGAARVLFLGACPALIFFAGFIYYDWKCWKAGK